MIAAAIACGESAARPREASMVRIERARKEIANNRAKRFFISALLSASSFRVRREDCRLAPHRVLYRSGDEPARSEGERAPQPPSLMSAIVAPVGSLMMEKRPTLGMSMGCMTTLPPHSSVRLAEASTSSTATYVIQRE